MTNHKTFAAPAGGFSFGPVHSGQVLADELAARALSANALALKLRVPANRITEIVTAGVAFRRRRRCVSDAISAPGRNSG